MGDRTRIKYTEAERLSFALCPETCPAVEAAFDKARAYDHSQWEAILAKYPIEDPKQLKWAIHEIVSKAVFNALHGLDEVVKYKGTFPLRLALVKKIEQELSAQGKPQETGNFERWMAQRKPTPSDT